MAWSPLTLLAIGCTVWAVVGFLVAWAFGSWARWVRGDFDRK